MSLLLHQVVEGSPITADADPNATEPIGKRIIGTPVKNADRNGGPFTLIVLLEDGTSISAQVFVKAPGLGDTWHSLGAAVVVNDLEAGNISAIVPPNSDVFVRFTAPVGAPTRVGVLLL